LTRITGPNVQHRFPAEKMMSPHGSKNAGDYSR